jgi:urease accessory protein
MQKVMIGAAAAAALVLVSMPAVAHPGHGHEAGLAAGLLHPLGGVDHLAAMLAVGLWAGFAGAARRWLWPAAFVAGMAAGIALGWSSAMSTSVELLIAATLLALGAALGARWSPSAAFGAVAVVAAGVVHGVAHDAEMPGHAVDAPFVAGILATTVMLHAVGVAAATRLRDVASARGVAGVACAGLGLVVIAGTMIG